MLCYDVWGNYQSQAQFAPAGKDSFAGAASSCQLSMHLHNYEAYYVFGDKLKEVK